VEDRVCRINARGLAGLCLTFRGQSGNPAHLPELAQLKAVIQRSPRQAGLTTGTSTGKVAAAFVTRTFGKTVSAATARRYLHRLGFARKRPRKWFIRANPGDQRAFAQALQQVEQRELGRMTVSMDRG
jgi:transposase